MVVSMCVLMILVSCLYMLLSLIIFCYRWVLVLVWGSRLEWNFLVLVCDVCYWKKFSVLVLCAMWVRLLCRSCFGVLVWLIGC